MFSKYTKTFFKKNLCNGEVKASRQRLSELKSEDTEISASKLSVCAVSFF